MRFKVGDLVWVAHNCPHNTKCRSEYGIIFKVRATTEAELGCSHCWRRETGQFVAHPRLPGGHYIPSIFLRLIDPDALIKTEPTHETETA